MIKIKKIPYAPKGDYRLDKWNYLKDAKKMNSFIKNGDVIYDCGANIFDHSIFFALNNPDSMVVAFEPVKEYYDLGLKNIDNFKIRNIVPINVALGEKSTKMKIFVDNESSSFLNTKLGLKTELACVKSIDYYVEKKLIPAPQVIKIDVEGYALQLIKGARKTIEKYKPTIIIEVHPMFVGVSESKQKIKELQKLGLNVVAKLSMGREFVLQYKDPIIDIDETFALQLVEELRQRYDSSKLKSDRAILLSEYKDIRKKYWIPFTKRMLWSNLFIFFTFRWLR